MYLEKVGINVDLRTFVVKCQKCRFTHFRVKNFGQKSASVKSLTNFMSEGNSQVCTVDHSVKSLGKTDVQSFREEKQCNLWAQRLSTGKIGAIFFQ